MPTVTPMEGPRLTRGMKRATTTRALAPTPAQATPSSNPASASPPQPTLDSQTAPQSPVHMSAPSPQHSPVASDPSQTPDGDAVASGSTSVAPCEIDWEAVRATVPPASALVRSFLTPRVLVERAATSAPEPGDVDSALGIETAALDSAFISGLLTPRLSTGHSTIDGPEWEDADAGSGANDIGAANKRKGKAREDDVVARTEDTDTKAESPQHGEAATDPQTSALVHTLLTLRGPVGPAVTGDARTRQTGANDRTAGTVTRRKRTREDDEVVRHEDVEDVAVRLKRHAEGASVTTALPPPSAQQTMEPKGTYRLRPRREIRAPKRLAEEQEGSMRKKRRR
ncbi:hypothetical protein OBBRIDRAFT_827966 [Obba rivulosa]|uniref:Uncharacterized protein n=1 Tax=Obba rivulosa TaxID=1052685 RepID=A0A8E2ALV2_9APHY|nr:hypothetical protein OBBRIDRAFT_827966 [Obba rivulosa]